MDVRYVIKPEAMVINDEFKEGLTIRVETTNTSDNVFIGIDNLVGGKEFTILSTWVNGKALMSAIANCLQASKEFPNV